VISSFIPADERIVTIEDAAELSLQQAHVITMEARPPNVEGVGAIPIRELVRNSLRMRPDRIIVGECRGGEALDMLQAMNTGHDGSMTTLHANSPKDAMSRLETMVLMAGADLPAKAIMKQIGSAIDVLVQAQRVRGGARRIVSVSEVTGPEGANAGLRSQLDGAFQAVAERVSAREQRRGRLPLPERMARAGLRFKPSEYIMAQLGCTAALALLAFARFGVSPFVPVAAL